ncbi:sensor domain-containing protein [Kitasatospora aureofaciens]|uniref:sensor histidine kinase n=1 Tax=Kitasatospora aureofaciens TaxID=1894 RepID=UPI0033C08A1E|nr:sensor domain-containing protein [Streptomyces viridifaciens]
MLAPNAQEERHEGPTGAVGALTGLRAHAMVPLRGAALAVLGLLGLVVLLPAAVAAGVGAVGVLDLSRRLPRLRRELAGQWSEVPVDDPYLPEPPEPRPRDSGLYRDGRQLYASYGSALRRRRVRQVRRDPATRRDLAFLLFDPFVGVPVASLPVALMAGGLYMVVAALCRAVGDVSPPGTAWAGAVVVAGAGLVSLATGLTVGPLVLWVHGCWTRLLLARRAVPSLVAGGGALGRRLRMLGAGALLSLLSMVGLVLAAVQVVALVAGLCTGLVLLFPKAVGFARRFVALSRRLAGDWLGVEIEAPYMPAPEPVRRGADGYYQYGRRLYRTPYLVRQLQLMRHTSRDPAVWRDLLWSTVNPLVAAVLLSVPLVVVGFSLFGLIVPGVLNLVTDGTGPYTFWDGALRRLTASEALAGIPWAAVAVGAVLMAAVSWVAPYALKAHARFALLLLRPTRHAQLARRVERLTETRADATGVQAAELRRIERDLHDGAQVTLVAIGMTLRVVERQLGEEAPELRELVAEARRQAATALSQLRDLVRGIHPPVLAERGVGDAVRAVALDYPLDVEVTVDVPGRPEAPVEACAYFAVCEVLANAAKHSGASRVRIDLRHSDGVLRMTVSDDGRGGADPAKGTGLSGVRRRLGTFDGDLFVSSPVGGPTLVTMELPCVLSSPRTSSS